MRKNGRKREKGEGRGKEEEREKRVKEKRENGKWREKRREIVKGEKKLKMEGEGMKITFSNHWNLFGVYHFFFWGVVNFVTSPTSDCTPGYAPGPVRANTRVKLSVLEISLVKKLTVKFLIEARTKLGELILAAIMGCLTFLVCSGLSMMLKLVISWTTVVSQHFLYCKVCRGRVNYNFREA